MTAVAKKVPAEQQLANAQQNESSLHEYLQTLIDSKKLPGHIKTIEEAFTIARMGKELGLQTMQAFHYILPVQGKLTLSAKVVGALLRRGGVEYTTKEDGVYIYADGSASDVHTKDEKPIDRRTTIIFIRNGREEVCSFTWKDAEKQGLTIKDNWQRMPREMLYARCLSKGSNRVGPDLLMGLYITEEMTDALNVPEQAIKRSEDGTIVEIVDVK